MDAFTTYNCITSHIGSAMMASETQPVWPIQGQATICREHHRLQYCTNEARQELDHVMNDVARTPQARHQIPQSHDAPASRKCRVIITKIPLNRHICGDLEPLLPPSCPISSPREVAGSVTICSTNTARLFHGIFYSQISTDAANLMPVHSGTRKRKVD